MRTQRAGAILVAAMFVVIGASCAKRVIPDEKREQAQRDLSGVYGVQLRSQERVLEAQTSLKGRELATARARYEDVRVAGKDFNRIFKSNLEQWNESEVSNSAAEVVRQYGALQKTVTGTGGETSDVSSIVGAIVDAGFKIYEKIKEQQKKEREGEIERYRKEIDRDYEWKTWDEIVSASKKLREARP